MYELNPCNVCMKLYKDTGPNVNDINNCVYEITRAYERVPNIDSFVKIDSTKCDKCIALVLKHMGPFPDGLTCCDLKVNPPPVYNQVPHYVPELITQNLSIEDAKQKCIQMCKLNTKYVNECINYCKIDAAALSTSQNTTNINNPIPPTLTTSTNNNEDDVKQKIYIHHNINYYLIFVLLFILITSIIYIK